MGTPDWSSRAACLRPSCKLSHASLCQCGIVLARLEKRVAMIEEKNGISALEKRIQELEARPVTEWRGVWRQGNVYAECSLVTDPQLMASPKRSNDGPTWILGIDGGLENGHQRRPHTMTTPARMLQKFSASLDKSLALGRAAFCSTLLAQGATELELEELLDHFDKTAEVARAEALAKLSELLSADIVH